jgi:hypothetical protein
MMPTDRKSWLHVLQKSTGMRATVMRTALRCDNKLSEFFAFCFHFRCCYQLFSFVFLALYYLFIIGRTQQGDIGGFVVLVRVEENAEIQRA